MDFHFMEDSGGETVLYSEAFGIFFRERAHHYNHLRHGVLAFAR